MGNLEDIPAEDLVKVLRYDAETGQIYRASTGKRAGVINNGYIRIALCGRAYYAHRLAYALYYGKWPSGYIDHINGQKTDNRISNLRVATKSQNGFNRGMPRHNQVGLKGVYLDKRKRRKKWRATIKVAGKQVHLGYFSTPEEAHKAYLRAASSAHGEFAWTGGLTLAQLRAGKQPVAPQVA